MASRTQRSWPVTARYVRTAAKARFPTTRLMPLSMRLPPPPKKGPLPAPAAPSRSRCRPAVLQGKAPLFPTNSVRTDGPAAEQDPFEILGGSFLNLGKRKACEQQQSGGGARRAGLSKATEAKGLSLRNCSSKFNFSPHLQRRRWSWDKTMEEATGKELFRTQSVSRIQTRHSTGLKTGSFLVDKCLLEITALPASIFLQGYSSPGKNIYHFHHK